MRENSKGETGTMDGSLMKANIDERLSHESCELSDITNKLLEIGPTIFISFFHNKNFWLWP